MRLRKRRPTSSNTRIKFLFRSILLLSIGFSACVNLFAFEGSDSRRGMELNESAIQKMNAGNLDGAQIDLLQALVYSNQNPQVRKNLGVLYYEKGVRAYKKKKDYQEARRFLKQALEISPKNENYRRAYANALLVEADLRGRKGQMQRALELFKEAAEFDPTNLSAWVRASNYAWETHQLELARRYLQKAKEISPTDRNVRVLEKKLAEGSVLAKEDTMVSEHFVLASDSEYIRTLGSHRIFYDLEEAFNAVSYKLSLYPKHKITVHFYPLKDFHEHWKVSRRVTAFYDGKVRIPYMNQETPVEVMRPIIMHELTHAFLDDIARQGLPHWLEEGLAQWVEGKELDESKKNIILSYERNNKSPSIAKLDGALAGKDALAYIKSYSIVKYLIENHGIWQLKKMIEFYDRRQSLDNELKKYFNSDSITIEGGWLRWLST